MEEERQLIEQAKSDPAVFGELYETYYPKIFRYVVRVCGDYTIASDITSETFIKALIHLNSFKWKGISISSWFFRIATNELNQYFRKRKYTPIRQLDLSLYGDDLSNHGNEECNTVLSTIYMTEEFRKVREQLSKLSPTYQKVIALRYFEEKSIKEISQIIGKKEGTVKSLLSRGIDRLRKLL